MRAKREKDEFSEQKESDTDFSGKKSSNENK